MTEDADNEGSGGSARGLGGGQARGQARDRARDQARELARDGVVPVMRFDERDVATAAAAALLEAGFSVLEVTLTVPGAPELIGELRSAHPDALVGAGTVLSLEDAERCLANGASFVVSPCLVEGLPAVCAEAGAMSVLGALTPSEVLAAWRQGATVVKVFPVSAAGGPAYVKALKSVMPDVPLLPTGGVRLANVPDYLRAGALAVGVGSDMFDTTALLEGRTSDAAAHARPYLEAGRARGRTL